MIARIKALSLCIFYVYALFDAYGIVRYIGKGKGNRWLNHESVHNSSNRNPGLSRIIRQTLKVLGEVPKIKIRENLTEFQAYTIEYHLIQAIGRLDLGTGPLANLSAGGRGVREFCFTEEQFKARNKAVSLGHLRHDPKERSERAKRREAARSPESRKASALNYQLLLPEVEANGYVNVTPRFLQRSAKP